MSFFPPSTETEGSARELLPAGTHEAYCFSIIDLGTHDRPAFKGKEKSPARAMLIGFEFTELLKKFGDDAPEEPRYKFMNMNYFTGDTSALYELTTKWLGKKVVDVDFASLPGMPASVTVTHSDPADSKDGKIYDNLSVAPLSEKLIPLMPKMYNNPFLFSILEDGFDSEKMKMFDEKRFEWIGKKIKASKEYLEYLNGPKETIDAPF